VAVALARGAFEYQGQKCSAASRTYIPQTLWNEVRDRLVAMIKDFKVGDVARLPQLHGRGDRQEGRSPKISEYLDDAKKNAE
jgi:1-pyrroline-5-carboxylate dehydrogenase